jgi:probable F420-dependent oxidoreductase
VPYAHAVTTLGLFGANMGSAATAEGTRRIGALAEELGYDSLWMGEHVVAPSPRVPPSPMEPDDPILDPLVALGMMAAVTRRVRLATGILILPQRNPVVLAKQLASLDVLSGGRLLFGIGVGYVEPEMSAIGVPMEGRGARADEYLRAMRSLWEDEAPAFRGDHVAFDRVDAHPRPVQRPLPVIVGGHSRAAHRRAVRHADGWYGFALDRAATATQIESLRREAQSAGRDLDELAITVSPSERLDPEVVRDFAQLGVDRLVLVPRAGLSLPDLEAWVRARAPAAVGAEPFEPGS